MISMYGLSRLPLQNTIGLSWTSIGSAGGNFVGQMLTGEGSVQNRLNDVNWIGVSAAGVIKKPFVEESVANSFSYTFKEDTSGVKFIATDKGGSRFLINVSVGTLIGKYVDIGMQNSFGSSLKNESNGLLKPATANTIEFTGSLLINSQTETIENSITSHLQSIFNNQRSRNGQ